MIPVEEKKAYYKGDVVVVHIKSDVAAADQLNQGRQTLLFNVAVLICCFLIKC